MGNNLNNEGNEGNVSTRPNEEEIDNVSNEEGNASARPNEEENDNVSIKIIDNTSVEVLVEDEDEDEDEDEEILTDNDFDINTTWKNHADFSRGYCWVYESFYKNSYWFMPLNNMIDLEEAKDSDVVINNFKYDFNNMTQSNTRTGTVRRIYRMSQNKRDDLIDDYNNLITTRGKYWVCDFGSHYVSYNPNIQNIMDGESEVVEIKMGNYMYLFDKVNNTQTNQNTNRSRPIKMISSEDPVDKKVLGSMGEVLFYNDN